MSTHRHSGNLNTWTSVRRTLLTSGLLAAASLAQSPTQLTGVNPPPDDPQVYYSFLHFHDDFSGWLERRNAENPAGAAKRTQAAAKLFGVTESELPRIAQISRSAAAQFRALAAEMQAYVDQKRANRQTPERAAFRAFEARRQQLIAAAVGQLRSTLPPASWTALHGYINDRHRLSIKQAKPDVRPQP